MILIDSNIWIYFLDERLPEHQQVSDALEEEIKSGILTTTTILLEVAHFLRGLPEKEFWTSMGYLKNLQTMRTMEFDLEMLDLAMGLLVSYADRGIGGRDSTILAAMIISGEDRIMTHDKAFKRIPSITVVDPIT